MIGLVLCPRPVERHKVVGMGVDVKEGCTHSNGSEVESGNGRGDDGTLSSKPSTQIASKFLHLFHMSSN